jgi:hypothetical protein
MGNEKDASSKNNQHNCRYCFLQKKADMKMAFVCKKCKVLLHRHYFNERIFYVGSQVEIIAAFQSRGSKWGGGKMQREGGKEKGGRK